MPIASTDILFKFSTGSATGAGDAVAGTANTSLGGQMSSTTFTDNVLDNVFDDINSAENASSSVDYRCIYIHNNHATLTYQVPVIWLSTTSTFSTMAIGIDTVVASAHTSATPQSSQILTDDHTTAPAGITFSSPTTQGTGLAIGDLVAGNVRALWFKRTATNSVAHNNDTISFSVSGGTGA